MSDEVDIERAFKDDEYLKSLTPEQLASIPANPAGDAELGEKDLDEISGGLPSRCATTTGSCLASKRSAAICGGC